MFGNDNNKKNTAEVSYSLALAELKYARAQLNSLQAELKSAQAEQKSRLTSLYVEELNLCSIKSSSRAKIQLRQKKKKWMGQCNQKSIEF